MKPSYDAASLQPCDFVLLALVIPAAAMAAVAGLCARIAYLALTDWAELSELVGYVLEVVRP